MQASNDMMQRLYHHLGLLFYAVASADRRLSGEETAKLYALVKQKWLAVDTSADDFGTDVAFQIISAYDLLAEDMPASEKCLKQFESFYGQHKSLFTDQIKALIVETAEAMAVSFRGMNKSELHILHEIQRILGPDHFF